MVLDFLKKAGKQLVSDIKGGLDLLSSAFVQPVKTAKALLDSPSKVVEVVKESKAKPLKEQVVSTVKTTAVTAGGLVVGSTILKGGVKYLVGSGGVLSEVGKKVAPKVALAALPVATVAVLAPKTTQKVLSTPGGKETIAASVLGGPVAGAIVGLEKGTSLVTEAIKGASTSTKIALGVGAGAVALGAGALVVSKLKGDELKEPIIETIGEPVLSSTGEMPVQTGEIKVPEAQTLPILESDKPKTIRKSYKRKPIQPIRILNKIENRNINKVLLYN